MRNVYVITLIVSVWSDRVTHLLNLSQLQLVIARSLHYIRIPPQLRYVPLNIGRMFAKAIEILGRFTCLLLSTPVQKMKSQDNTHSIQYGSGALFRLGWRGGGRTTDGQLTKVRFVSNRLLRGQMRGRWMYTEK